MKQVQKGFTLIELMIVVTLVAIIATVAVPSFQGLVESNRQKSTTNSVLGLLNFPHQKEHHQCCFQVYFPQRRLFWAG